MLFPPFGVRASNPLFPWCEVSEIFTTSVG
jgi:hypothetical protein